MLQIATFAALVLYLGVLARVLSWVGGEPEATGARQGALLIRGFILAQALFCLPLPVRSMLGLPPEGNVSPDLVLFAGWIPAALLYCAAFNVVLAVAYRALLRRSPAPGRIVSPEGPGAPTGLGPAAWAATCAVALLSVWMLGELAQDAGGLLGLVLLGYRVTETFVGRGHFAVAFDWLAALAVVAAASALRSRSPRAIVAAALPALVLGGAFLVMGRRGSLVILGVALLYVFHELYRPIPRSALAAIFVAGFLALNVVGLLRGSDYEDLGAALESAQGRTERLQDGGEASDLLYAVTTGQFAVPFETLPQVMRTFGITYPPGFGLYALQGLALLVPSALWPDRPLPLANWYMARFYGVTELNEGRQFFFLTDAYMNFGPLGFALWGLLFAWIFWMLGRVAARGESDPLVTAGVALVAGSLLALVAVDLPAFAVAFVKGFGAPILLLWVVRRLTLRPAPGVAT